MRPKLATLSVLEWIAGLARRLGLGFLVDRLAPLVARPFERFELDVDGVRLAGTELAHLHYVRELMEHGREQTFVRLLDGGDTAGRRRARGRRAPRLRRPCTRRGLPARTDG